MSIELVGAGAGQAPGWFGKLPSHGDFLARRLPPAVRLCFDDWLQRGLLQSRTDLGDAWLPAWLASPLWRFVVAPGVCGAQAWMGVLMPSHDRVGRCFPLLLMAAAGTAPLLADCLSVHEDWFVRLEDLALSTLEERFSLETLDTALMALGGAPVSGHGVRACGALVQAPTAGAWETMTAGQLPALARVGLGPGQSAWWTAGAHKVAPCLAVCPGLPGARQFAALLDGRWARMNGE